MTGCDLVVVGGGPAGLSCAMFAARQGIRTRLVEATALGGQLVTVAEIDDLPGTDGVIAGWDLAAIMTEQAHDAGVEVTFGEVVSLERHSGLWHVGGHGLDLTSRVVVLATGSTGIPLGIPGEQELLGRGVSSCTICDGPLFRGEPVAVVGGGDVAMHEAALLAPLASDVIVLLPGPRPSAGAARLATANRHANLVLRPSARVVEILGDAAVSGVRYVDGDGSHRSIAVRAVFVAGERRPTSALVGSVAHLDDRGAVATDAGLRAAPGLFAVGDVRAGSPFCAAAAIGDGAQAALSAVRMLAGTTSSPHGA